MYNLVMMIRDQIVKESMMIKMLMRTKTMMRIRRGKMPKEKQQTATSQTSLTKWKMIQIAIMIAIMRIMMRTKRSMKTIIKHQ